MKKISFAMDSNLRSLSPHETRIVLSLAEDGRRELDRTEIIALLGVSADSADQVIRSLRKKGWLERAGRGRYLLIPPDQGPDAIGESNLLALASRIADPYYFAYSTAAAHYGLTTQARNVVWIATTRSGLRTRELLGASVRFVHLTPRKFFGYETVRVFGYPVLMSDREKTIIDCVDRMNLAGNASEVRRMIAAAARRIDWEKITHYLEQIGSVSLIQRFGFLTATTEAPLPPDARARLRQHLHPSSRSILGPAKKPPRAIGYDQDWQLMVHLTPQDLGGEVALDRKQAASS
jgi:predicted transcriptional regulator of viral defense system